MEITLDYDLIRNLVERSGYNLEYADNFGGREHDHTCNGVIVADSWQALERAKLSPKDGYGWTRLGQQLKDQNVTIVFSNEYTVDYELNDDMETLAWRMLPDSYVWEPQAMYDGNGGLVTIDDPTDIVLEALYSMADLTPGGTYYRGLPNSWSSKLTEPIEGFTIEQVEPEETYYTGWHRGMNDDPAKVVDEVVNGGDDDIYLAILTYKNSQFYNEWQVWLVRETD